MQAFTFSQMKIQILEIIESEPGLKDAPMSLACHLVLTRCAGSLGLAAVTDSQIAAAKNCSTDKISRAVKMLAESGLFEIKRGRWNVMTEYRVSERVWNEATRRRNRPRNVADLPLKYTQQIRDQDPAKLQTKTPQNCPAFKSKDIKKEPTPELIASTFVLKDVAFALKQWNEFLSKCGVDALDVALPLEKFEGRSGYWLPGPWPIFTEGAERNYQASWLKCAAHSNRISQSGELLS